MTLKDEYTYLTISDMSKEEFCKYAIYIFTLDCHRWGASQAGENLDKLIKEYLGEKK